MKLPKGKKISTSISAVRRVIINGFIPVIDPSEEEKNKIYQIFELNPQDLRCVYCNDTATEWDHFRPIIFDKRSTGYFTEIYNLVPACGKCNQSKGNKDWKDWINSSAKLSPKMRMISNFDKNIEKLENYQKWSDDKVRKFDVKYFEFKELIDEYIIQTDELENRIKKFQIKADVINELIKKSFTK